MKASWILVTGNQGVKNEMMPSFSAGVRTLSFGMMPLFLMVCFTHRFYPLAIQHLNKNWCAKNDLLDHP
ncbi:MAG: hypothetical protein KDI77_17335, partial [Gammaproteobacteria bacterium]|nr:hypothetical protein [Gammaproteobacteria bacterium]